MIRGKPVCPVLRGAGRSNAPCLPGENVGRYANGGAEYQRQGEPEKTNTYDFIGESGKAVPYGVYDVAANAGWVNVGTDADTGEFAVESIRRWWAKIGVVAYPEATGC